MQKWCKSHDGINNFLVTIDSHSNTSNSPQSHLIARDILFELKSNKLIAIKMRYRCNKHQFEVSVYHLCLTPWISKFTINFSKLHLRDEERLLHFLRYCCNTSLPRFISETSCLASEICSCKSPLFTLSTTILEC